MLPIQAFIFHQSQKKGLSETGKETRTIESPNQSPPTSHASQSENEEFQELYDLTSLAPESNISDGIQENSLPPVPEWESMDDRVSFYIQAYATHHDKEDFLPENSQGTTEQKNRDSSVQQSDEHIVTTESLPADENSKKLTILSPEKSFESSKPDFSPKKSSKLFIILMSLSIVLVGLVFGFPYVKPLLPQTITDKIESFSYYTST